MRKRKTLEPVFSNKYAADNAEYELQKHGWTTKQDIRYDKNQKVMYVILAEKYE